MIFDPRNHPLRSSAIIVAVASSMALLVTMSSLSVGIKDSSKEAIEGVGADIYVVPDSLNPLLLDLQRFEQGWAVIKEIEEGPTVPSYLSPRLKDTLFYRNENAIVEEVSTYGIIPGNEEHFGQFRVIRGSWFIENGDPVRERHLSGIEIDNTSFTQEVLISEEFSRNTGTSIGDLISLSTRMSSIEPLKYRVEGIYVNELSRRSESIIIHLGELQYLKGMIDSDSMTEILLSYPPGTDLEEIIRWSENETFMFRELVDLYTENSFLSELYKFTTILDGFSAMVIIVTLFVCLVFTSTIFMISTKERLIELSILRAIGIPRWRILIMIITGSLVLYSIGTVLGILSGMGLNIILDHALNDLFQGLPTTFEPFRFDPTILGWTVLSALMLSLASGIIPALISSTKPPAETIRGEI